MGKRQNNSAQFDVSTGSYDGAEICELVGLYMLHKLDQRFNNNKHTGLYRDDGLAAFRNMGPRTAEKMKKEIKEVFNQAGLRITIETNQKVVNYLDITLNLLTEKYYPYRKPENTPLYINARSNLVVKKNLTKQPLHIMMPSSLATFPNGSSTTRQAVG